MADKIVVRKLTASEISGSIMYSLNLNPFPNSVMVKAIERGKIAHSRNGFTNTKLYSRFYKGIEIVGIPDRIDTDFVYEFKTYSSPQTKIRNEKVGLIQIVVYEFITGLKGQLVMYDIHQDKITKTIVVPFKKSKFRTIITQAIKLKKTKILFVNKYREIQKESRTKIFR